MEDASVEAVRKLITGEATIFGLDFAHSNTEQRRILVNDTVRHEVEGKFKDDNWFQTNELTQHLTPIRTAKKAAEKMVPDPKPNLASLIRTL